MKLSHPDKDKLTCVSTDASDRFWAAVVTQTTNADLKLSSEQQQHEPLAFLRSAFKSAALRWSTFENEAFAIYQVFTRLDYLVYTESPVHVFTDHRNLLFVFSPHSLEHALGRRIVSKVQRWELHLPKYEYVIKHIDGSENAFADILTRWTKGYRSCNSARRISMVKLVDGIFSSPYASDFIWPDLPVFKTSQAMHSDARTNDCVLKGNGQLYVND